MKKMFFLASIALSTTVFAAPTSQEFTITTHEITPSQMKALTGSYEGGVQAGRLGAMEPTDGGQSTTPTTPPKPTFSDRVDQAGKIIQSGKDIIALGEAIYDLVKKGKPSNTSDYAPISVVPRDPSSKEYVDPFELENFSMPVEKNFVTKITGGGSDAVEFTYKVVYAYGGSYNGAGKYLTSVMVVPVAVRTSFGWDFNAQMKLGGIMNNGSKADPVAGVIINLKYQMNSWSAAFERTDSIYINGRGEMKNMGSR